MFVYYCDKRQNNRLHLKKKKLFKIHVTALLLYTTFYPRILNYMYIGK